MDVIKVTFSYVAISFVIDLSISKRCAKKSYSLFLHSMRALLRTIFVRVRFDVI